MWAKLIELEGEINKSTVTLGDISTTLSNTINRTTRQKISANIEEINITSNLRDLIYIYRIPHSTTIDYTLFQVFIEHIPR